MRTLPFFKPKKGVQFAGEGVTDSSGGGGGYTLPTATASRLGGVKVGSGLSVEEDGTLSASGGGGGFTPPQFSATEFDTGYKWVDGRTIYGIVFTDTIGSGAGRYYGNFNNTVILYASAIRNDGGGAIIAGSYSTNSLNQDEINFQTENDVKKLYHYTKGAGEIIAIVYYVKTT